MGKDTMSVKKLMDTIVPISRFNRGEANKIFDEVNKNGVKIVLKNNIPACVLVRPERYEEMVEALEDYALFFEAEQRMKSFSEEKIYTAQEICAELGIQESDFKDIEVDLE